MATLSELKASISEMSDDELNDLLRAVRHNRRKPIERKAAPKKTKVAQAVAEMPTTDKAALLKQLRQLQGD